MLERLFPPRIDNTYRGFKVALWLFGLMLFMRTTISVRSIFSGYSVASVADGIPLATYSAPASSTIVSLFALLGLSNLMLCVIGIVALIRYRSTIPLMFAIFLFHHIASRVIGRMLPIPKVGTPPGTYVINTLLAILVVGLVLSLANRPAARETSQSATVP